MRIIYRYLIKLFDRIRFLLSINWFKTFVLNFKKLPFSQAIKFPFIIYGNVRFTAIEGEFIIDAPIKTGMVGFGQPYEINKVALGISELNINGTIVFKGHCQFGKDFFIFSLKGSICEFGHMSSLGGRGKIICANSIKFGDFARLGPECQVIDTNFHKMKNTLTGEVYEKTKPIVIGNYNFVSNRVTVLKGTITPGNCTIASNSVCNKDYTFYGNNILLGGVPVKLIKENIARDWQGEMLGLESYLKIF